MESTWLAGHTAVDEHLYVRSLLEGRFAITLEPSHDPIERWRAEMKLGDDTFYGSSWAPGMAVEQCIDIAIRHRLRAVDAAKGK